MGMQSPAERSADTRQGSRSHGCRQLLLNSEGDSRQKSCVQEPAASSVPGMFARRSIAVAALVGSCAFAAASCTAVPAPAAVTRLQITTLQIICGGRVQPGVPFCRTPTSASRAVEVGTRGQVVASGTTDSRGKLLVEVPAGTWTVTVPGAMVYEDCDRPTVTAVQGVTTQVTQTCILNVP
jgi:hypothetical protein